MKELGKRIRELRRVRNLGPSELGLDRAYLCRIETSEERHLPSLAFLEKVAVALGCSPGRFFLTAEEFDVRLIVEDTFVLAVLPYLGQLNAEQKLYILKVLGAAPKQTTNTRTGRPRLGSTAPRTLHV